LFSHHPTPAAPVLFVHAPHFASALCLLVIFVRSLTIFIEPGACLILSLHPLLSL
jgi:hypothetical protein